MEVCGQRRRLSCHAAEHASMRPMLVNVTTPGWGVGLTILTAFGNLLPVLPEEETDLPCSMAPAG
jgi:hypothetical protein